MHSQLPLLPIIALVLAWALIIHLNLKRDTRTILQKQFAVSDAPKGPLVACKVRFPLEEMSTPCVVQAGKAGLYMVSPQEEVAKWRWTNNVPYLRQQIFIPWSRLEARRARFPLHNYWLRFEVRGTKAVFFIRKTIALDLLRQAGQSVTDSK